MDSLEERLNKIEKNIKKKVDGFVSFRDLFPDSFIRNHSKFSSIDDILEQSGFRCETQKDFDAIDEPRLDNFICENTDFESWDAMKQAANVEYVKRKITV